MRFSSLSTLVAVGAVAALAACSDSGAPATPGTGQLNFSLATRAPGGAPSIAAAAPDSQFIGNDTLVIDSAQVVLRKIDLLRMRDSANACAEDDHMGNDDNQGDDDHEGHDGIDDDCETLKAGPLILDLPLTPGASQSFSVSVDTGTFSAVHFQIHKLTGGAGDQALLALHPEFTGISVRVVGTFNGTPFVYTSDLTANQAFQFTAPVAVATAGNVDLTLMVDVNGWFANGGVLVDPATAAQGGANENLVRDNIRDSFRAFRDDDHDCHDDDGGDDNGHHGGGDGAPVAR